MGLNKVLIIGNLGGEPEMRFTGNGTPVTNFSVAVSRRFHDHDHQLVEETEWFPVVTWGKQAESCNQFLFKGSSVFVEGRLETDKWKDRDGVDREKAKIIASNVIFLTRKQANGSDYDAEVDAGGDIDEAAERIDASVRSQKSRVNTKRKLVEAKQEKIEPEDIPF